MHIHKEGFFSITLAFLLHGIFLTYLYFVNDILSVILSIVSGLALLGIVGFFRIPKREHPIKSESILAPCDGKVVAVEEIEPDEYFAEKRLQISVFMSVFDVHVNLNPVTGRIVYNNYHPGKHLVAWHPKSSNDNERHVVVYQLSNGREIMAKQIAGALARRIVNYLPVGTYGIQGDEMGFIKFGSRVDLILPTDIDVNVVIGEKVKGGITALAFWKS